MVVIMVNMDQMLHFIQYVNLLILMLNRPNLDAFYSDVEIALRFCFHMKKKIYFVIFLQLSFTTTKMFLNDLPVFSVHLNKSTSVWGFGPFLAVRKKESFTQRRYLYCLNSL